MADDELITDIPGNNGSLWKALLIGTAVAVAFGLGGFFLVRDDKTGAMGVVLFVLLPFATGLATSLVVRGRTIIFASLIMGAVICTGVLIATKMEGWVCLLMSTPLIAIGLALGALVGFLIGRQIDKQPHPHTITTLLVLTLPLFLMGANSAEKNSRRVPRELTVENRLVVDASPEAAWNQLKSIDRVNGTKGFLMKIGLPVPVSCSMEGEGVGARRTCYFEEGHIEERVTEWNPPKSMKFEITNFDVPGRPWLSFKDASYDIVQENGKTVIIRNTTIISRLAPVVYWRPLETIGVETEHEYLFEELKRRLDGVK
jgi:hypothetical protein